jgi:hypothetical protein
VPYPFAHPAAVLPLVRPMGRFAVPSALVIGSIAPDLWHLVPHVSRAESHTLAALGWFSLPVGLLCYFLFHGVVKEPLVELLWPRLKAFVCRGLPRTPWHAVLISLIVGALTHLVWDGLTHTNDHTLQSPNWLQHINTMLGTAILMWWIWRQLRGVPARAPSLSRFARACTALAATGAMAVSVLWSADAWPALDRQLLKDAAIAALQGLAAALFVYCILFRRKIARRAV